VTVDIFIYKSYLTYSHFVSYLYEKYTSSYRGNINRCAETLSFDYGLNTSHHALNYGPITTIRRNNTVGNGVYINISQALLDFISYLCWTSIWFNKMCVG